MKLILLVFALAVAAAPAARAQDARRGRVLFAQCAACHSVGPGGNGRGPSLKGVVGRRSGTVRGFDYSGQIRRAGLTWDDSTLNAFLAEPQVVLPGVRMPAAGVPEAKDRADLIAYLKTAR